MQPRASEKVMVMVTAQLVVSAMDTIVAQLSAPSTIILLSVLVDIVSQVTLIAKRYAADIKRHDNVTNAK